MKIQSVVVGLLVAVLMSMPSPRSLVAQEGVIRGVVQVGTVPVEDAEVVIPALGRRTKADRAGRFRFERVPAGGYVIEANSVRWGRGVESVEVAAGQSAEVVIQVETIFHLDELIISAGAGAMRRSEAYQPASVVTARDLVAGGEASLGETLADLPGVSSTYFGPGASRPVIRGLGGDRVRILEGGIGVGDASSTSPDHAVGIEARGAERIEVIRGPATLLYGSSAVGGIVNVLDGRIAREEPTESFTGYVEALGGSVADERTGSAGVTMGEGPLVVNLSGLWRDASDYSIPGFADIDATPEEAERGVLENSALETRRVGGGVTLVGDHGYLGVAFGVQRSDYGVPAEHADEGGAVEEAPITIDLDQNRFDLEGAVRLGGGTFRNVKGRFGYADYQHVELEGSEVGTRFFNNFFEGRLESEHSFGDAVQGAFGAQLSERDFEAVGEEAFVPPTTLRSTALFAYEAFEASERGRVQAGLRYERQEAASPEDGIRRTDDAISSSLGLNVDISELLTLSVSGSRSVKLPNSEELFSNGPHAATQAYEIGDPDLAAETAWGLDLTTHLHADRVRGTGSFFLTRFSDYIHEAATGAERDGLDEFVFVQDDARFIGFELEGEVDVLEGSPAAGAAHLSIELMADMVRAELVDRDEPLPRIPPMTFGGGLNYSRGGLVARGSVRRTTGQSRVGPFETATDGFTIVDASASYRIISGDLFHDITLTVSNLTNSEARLHTSFLKNLAPLPGREVRLIYRLNF